MKGRSPFTYLKWPAVPRAAGSASDQIKLFCEAKLPCSAKKFEKTRHGENELADVDIVLTTRELADYIKDNPAGQDDECTPFVLIRDIGDAEAEKFVPKEKI